MKKVLIFILSVIMLACGNENPSETSIQSFIESKDDYGSLKRVFEKPEWEDGMRFEVTTDSGAYWFYLNEENEVVGVFRLEKSGGRTQLFLNDSYPDLSKVAKEIEIPDYKVLFKVKLMTGKGVFGEVLITDYSKDTPIDEIEETLRVIMTLEGFASAVLYSTEEAHKAGNSASYAERHPDALANGYLGQIDVKGKFLE